MSRRRIFLTVSFTVKVLRSLIALILGLEASRWLLEHDPEDFEGDHSVGWWLLLYLGIRMPPNTRNHLNDQLQRLLPKFRFGKSNLYTATAIARTLLRAGYLLQPHKAISSFQRALIENDYYNNISNLTQASILPLDIIWLIQALFELGGLSKPDVINAVKRIFSTANWSNGLSACMLWPIIEQVLNDNRIREICTIIDEQTSQINNEGRFADLLDWECGYFLQTFCRRNTISKANTLAQYLIQRLSNSQWDEGTDENIESTSLVGLSMCSYWKLLTVETIAKRPEDATETLLSYAILKYINESEDFKKKWEILKSSQSDPNKGKLLEEFIVSYAKSDPELDVESMNRRTRTEELDLVIESSVTSGILADLEGRFILIECKYTRKKTSADQIRNFCPKVLNRKRSICSTGVFISMAGFTKGASDELFRLNSQHPRLIFASVAGEELEEAVTNDQLLSDLIEKSILKVTYT